ncbi:protein DGS1, mitochondrial-like isoform X1 [Cucurbita pepo subsp. pepo]|uniref:protein DGS1, mitochondrial-like isoform X1 n=1 Tax=Cucurbita pepo subsp. pepo TaxID=3664 RepID=UPI000C9D30D5|nr:protein DGS1, mitochondrial-like isoform X1 [Cucurbita pepo subsp. pepo]
METTPEESEDKSITTSISQHSLSVWRRILAFFPLPRAFSFLWKLSGFPRRRSRKIGFPLPQRLESINSSVLTVTCLKPAEASRLYDVLDDILEHCFLSLYNIWKNLQFWQSRAEGTNAQKAYFMICERGPRAFFNGTVQLMRQICRDGFSLQHVAHDASCYIAERITILSYLRNQLAAFVAQVFMNTDNIGTDSGNDLQNPLPSLLVALNGLFLDLETSICELHTTLNMDFHGSFSFPLFKKLPDVNKEGSQWTSCEIGDAINLLCQNFHKLDNVISIIVLKHRKPKKLTRHWLKYTCGAIGLSVCSVWLLQHSKLMGSNDIENWVREAHNSAAKFFKDHVQQPLISIRDELFATFRKRHKGIMDGQDVQLTTDSLRRMLHAFSEHTEGRKFADAASDEEMFAKVMFRYEKELKHPVQNLLSGELARALLIQVQKLKLDIETAMLELDQILKANEINFAVLAALPAFFISLLLLMLLRAWYMQDTRAEGKGRAARLQRRLLVVEVEKAIMQYQSFVDQGHVKNAESSFGLLLYSLGRLYHASEKHAKATGEWLALRQDLLELGKPSLPTRDKLIIASRIERIYDCLLPASTRL